MKNQIRLVTGEEKKTYEKKDRLHKRIVSWGMSDI